MDKHDDAQLNPQQIATLIATKKHLHSKLRGDAKRTQGLCFALMLVGGLFNLGSYMQAHAEILAIAENSTKALQLLLDYSYYPSVSLLFVCIGIIGLARTYRKRSDLESLEVLIDQQLHIAHRDVPLSELDDHKPTMSSVRV